MPIEIKIVTEADYDAFSDVTDVGLLRLQERGRGPFRRTVFADDIAAGRAIGAYDGGRVVGTFGNYANTVTVPGGAAVPVSAVTAVTVAQTHRRRGILSSMTAEAFRQSADAGVPLSMLIPAEWPIYGRFGYGHATDETRYTFDTKRCATVRPLPGTVDFASAPEWVEAGRAVYERLRVATPGAIERRNAWWERESGLLTHDGRPLDKESLFVVYRDEAGTPRGVANYQPREGSWEGFVPDNGAEAYMIAEDYVARVRLLQFLWEQDWFSSFSVAKFPADDTWRHLMADPRVARQKQRYDVLWVRVLDVVAALGARTYEGEGRLVLAVTDPDGYAEGVYALEGGPAGATVKRSTETPDLTLPVQTLGALYLGQHAASALARVGEVAEEKPGALALADRMFKTAVPPYCVTWF
ncbi:GNAT family N-acetyltransferase [Catenulispora sp. NF23]|uniref:GNAT family N-acetyltransferase n=1 Tax=Catenulispora pinistramenti TaxID=2705254 RepID=A0ABS5KWJ1_9ACTN|nr:GNAT family N-acetyltransferase [Catenulispora pinistramenti]MBS2534457.1 GNAT family N-acetyltransferase [Catenulispora pinistramenti]MBS2550423.1 GNAT family N-acetyltransferase [Catenulispora pinistramenti]